MSNLLLRRRMMMQAGGSPTPPVPYDSKIAYLQGNGNIRITTNIVFDWTTKLTITMAFGATNSRTIFCGINGGWGDAYLAVINQCVEEYAYRASSVNVANTTSTFVRAVGIKTCNGINIAYDTTNGDPSWFNSGSTMTFTIFGYQYNGNWNHTNLGDQFISAEIEQNGSLAHKLYPVRIGSIGYIYDEISGDMWTNQQGGLGAGLILGPDIN